MDTSTLTERNEEWILPNKINCTDESYKINLCLRSRFTCSNLCTPLQVATGRANASAQRVNNMQKQYRSTGGAGRNAIIATDSPTITFPAILPHMCNNFPCAAYSAADIHI